MSKILRHTGQLTPKAGIKFLAVSGLKIWSGQASHAGMHVLQEYVVEIDLMSWDSSLESV